MCNGYFNQIIKCLELLSATNYVIISYYSELNDCGFFADTIVAPKVSTLNGHNI